MTQKAAAPGLTLYAVLRELQALVAVWTDTCLNAGNPACPWPGTHPDTPSKALLGRSSL
jgi:hypothetical protein